MNELNKAEFELAVQDKITEYADYVEYVLERLGHPEALVTDESGISDFMDRELFEAGDLNEDGQKYLEHLAYVLEVDIEATDLLWEIAAKVSELYQ